MDGMDWMDAMDPEGEALHLRRAAGARFASSLLSPHSFLLTPYSLLLSPLSSLRLLLSSSPPLLFSQ
jgi:hypothetical protein